MKIEFEGTDGAGKTTALKYFVEQARKRGLAVAETREVGNPHVPSCVKMREFVLNPENNLSGQAMELIFSAMRFESDKWLKEQLSSSNPPDMVVSDRGYLSHLAYTDHNVSAEFTQQLYVGLMDKLTLLPDVVVYFHIDSATALKRRNNRGTSDVIEMKGVPFQEKVRDSFTKYIGVYSDQLNVYHVDANQSIEEVRTRMDEVLDALQHMVQIRKAEKQSGAQ